MAAPAYVSGAARHTGAPNGWGLTTQYLTFVGMADPPVAGDICFGVAHQDLDNPNLAVSAGWTVDGQHNDPASSWIVFHRAIETGDIGPTVSGIDPGSGKPYYSSLWTYRNFNGFDGTPAVAYSDTAVLDLPSGTISRTDPSSLVVAEWSLAGYAPNDRVFLPFGTDGAAAWQVRQDTFQQKWYDNVNDLPVAAGTFGPITAKRRNVFSHAYVATPYFSVVYALRSTPVGGGWGVGAIRMGGA